MGEVIVVCGALAFKGDKFILVKEAQPICYGKWNFPAGYLDAGEDICTAAVREVKEETNVDVVLDGLIGVYGSKKEGKSVVRFIFKATVVGGELKHREGELLDARWVSVDEFNKIPDSELRVLDLRDTLRDYQTKPLIPLDRLKMVALK